ncbi:hypothetical protein HMPREF9554_00271, partial [Treponema phagedenis F0421]
MLFIVHKTVWGQVFKNLSAPTPVSNWSINHNGLQIQDYYGKLRTVVKLRTATDGKIRTMQNDV